MLVGKAVEWLNRGVVEWWSGGVVNWWGGGVVGRWMVDQRIGGFVGW